MTVLSLIYTGLLALGIFTFDAWMHPDIINLSLTLPKGLGASETSIGDAVAENLFLNEVADIDEVPTFVVKPRVRSTSDASLVSLVGELFGLRKLTVMVQHVTGVEPVIIAGSLTKRNDRYQLVLASNPEAGPRHRMSVAIESVAGEPIGALIRRGAVEAMLSYEDYLVCLHLLMKAHKGELAPYEASLPRPGAEGLDLLMQERLQKQPSGLEALPKAGELAKRRAMFTNLRGVLALQQADDGKAAALFEEAIRQRPDFAIAYLNLAFVRVHQDRYQEAIDLSRRIVESGAFMKDPILAAAARTTWGVAAWGLRRFDDAAAEFALAAADYPRSTMAYLYWSEMLAALGDSDGAAAKNRIAIENVPYFENYAETAMLHFRLSPQDKAPLTRL